MTTIATSAGSPPLPSAKPGGKPRIDLVVEDIDNTKYDFFGSWATAFTKALDVLATDRVGSDPAQREAWTAAVKRDVQSAVAAGRIDGNHVYHDFGEVILRTPTLNPKGRFDARTNPGGREELTPVEQRAVALWTRTRQMGIKPFEGVRETLKAIGATGARDVAWTDAPFSSLAARMPRLFGGSMREAGIDTVYCQPDGGKPPSDARLRAAEKAIGAKVVVLTADTVGTPDTAKPSRRAFEYILAREAADPGRTLIVGDHFRDFVAAQWRGGDGALLPAGQRPVGVWQMHGADGEPLTRKDGRYAAAVPTFAVPLTRDLLGEARLEAYPLGSAAIRDRIGSTLVQQGPDGQKTIPIAKPDLVIEAGQGAKGYRQLLDLVTLVPQRARTATPVRPSPTNRGKAEPPPSPTPPRPTSVRPTPASRRAAGR